MSGLGFLSCLTPLLFGGALAVAQEKVDTVESVQRDFNALQQKRFEERKKNPLPAGAQAPLVTEDEILGFIDRSWKIYDQSEGEPAEFDSLQQVMRLSLSAPGPKMEEHWGEAAEKLFATFVDDDRMAAFVMSARAPQKFTAELQAWLDDVKSKTRNANVQAAFVYKDLPAEISKSSNGELDEAQEKALIARLEDLEKKFGAQTVPGGKTTYSQFVKTTVFAIQNLKVGGVAPEIAAKDLDGVDFKLSDYRGKVVLLDFWGYW